LAEFPAPQYLTGRELDSENIGLTIDVFLTFDLAQTNFFYMAFPSVEGITNFYSVIFLFYRSIDDIFMTTNQTIEEINIELEKAQNKDINQSCHLLTFEKQKITYKKTENERSFIVKKEKKSRKYISVTKLSFNH
jgi:hypothetical protein